MRLLLYCQVTIASRKLNHHLGTKTCVILFVKNAQVSIDQSKILFIQQILSQILICCQVFEYATD